MKATSALKSGLVKVRRHWRASRHKQALAEVERLLQQYDDNPGLLVLRAELIQLQNQSRPAALADAKTSLQRAVDLDAQSPGPLIELGHFLFAVEDDAEAASECFEKAVALSQSLLREALLGQAEALSELGRRRESLACLAQAYWLQSHNGKSGGHRDREEILERLELVRRAE